MMTPLQLTFRSMARSDALALHLQRRVDQLDRVYHRIISCHVVVELDGHHHAHGDRLRFSIHVGLPGHELVVSHGPREDRGLENAHVAADRAFDEADRQLEDWIRRRSEHHPHGAAARPQS
jgi:ribosome-associated translation inhibitor RaiA